MLTHSCGAATLLILFLACSKQVIFSSLYVLIDLLIHFESNCGRLPSSGIVGGVGPRLS